MGSDFLPKSCIEFYDVSIFNTLGHIFFIAASSSRQQMYKPENDRLDTIREQNHPALKSRGLVENNSGKPASVDDILDNNLDEMAMGLSRLKGLALDLNAELDEHDDILIRLDDKASRTGIKVEKQNKDMSKILNKKWALFSIVSQQFCFSQLLFTFSQSVINQ